MRTVRVNIRADGSITYNLWGPNPIYTKLSTVEQLPDAVRHKMALLDAARVDGRAEIPRIGYTRMRFNDGGFYYEIRIHEKEPLQVRSFF